MAKVNLITTENVTPAELESMKRLISVQDGTAENPYMIASRADLEQLRQDVENGDCKEGKHFLQTADIDMGDEPWAGIGLKSGDDPDSEHTFKGVYDGGNHVISNLSFTYVDGGDNELYGFFRSCMGATIRNLTINVSQSDGHGVDGGFAGAAFVGTVKDGVTMVNCTANGMMGSDVSPCGHTAAGVIAYVTTPTERQLFQNCVTLVNVVNNVNVFSVRKVGGIIGFMVHDLILDNVVNNGMVVRVTGKARDDGVGAIVGFANTEPHPRYRWNNVVNTGHVEVNADATPATVAASGQLMGLFAAESGDESSSTGDVKFLLNDQSLPLSGTASYVGIGYMGLWFGQVKSDGFCHVVKSIVAGGKYIYLFGETNNATYVLNVPGGEFIIVDQRFGTPKIVGPDRKPIKGVQIGDTDEYVYTVFPDPANITDTCTVSIPSNIVDGTTVTGTTLNAATGSMTVTKKRVTQFQAKFSPGTHVEAADTISPVITFDRCVIATNLEFYGDCAASGKPITIVFNNCVFDGSGHSKQFLFLQYGEKYSVADGQISVVDSSAVAKYNVVLNNVKFINLDPDKDSRALFKGFGSTLDRPDLEPGAHFDPNENALSAQTILADQDAAALVDGVDGADKGYKAGAQYEYHKFQAGSYGTVTNI